MTKKAVVDAGPIIHLDELNCIGLLDDFGEIVMPHTVWHEIEIHRSESLRKFSFVKMPLKLHTGIQLRTMCQMFSLHAGEIEAVTYMELYPDAIFLTDDCAARLVAARMGFKVHGTIGILLRAVRLGRISPQEVVSLLTQIPLKSSLHIKLSLLKEICDKIRQEFNL